MGKYLHQYKCKCGHPLMSHVRMNKEETDITIKGKCAHSRNGCECVEYRCEVDGVRLIFPDGRIREGLEWRYNDELS